jgi:hypothetical protein
MGPLSVYVGKGPKIRRLIFLTSAIRIPLIVYNVAAWNFFLAWSVLYYVTSKCKDFDLPLKDT